MTKNKVFLSLFMVLLAICIAGCSTGKSTVWSPGKPFAKDAVKIGIIVADEAESGWSYSHIEGLKKTQKELGLRDDQIIARYNVGEADQAMVESNIADLIADGANIVIAPSSRYVDACDSLAPKYPNVVFAAYSGIKSNETNFTYFYGRVYQARYLAGIVAGLKTETNKVGVVAISDGGSTTNSFAIGVENANPDAEVYVTKTNGWYDPEAERLAVRKLINEGCDVIISNVNTSVSQVEAEKAGKWAIGVHSDMAKEAPNAILTSVVWDFSVYYNFLVNSVIDGSFKPAYYNVGIVDGMVDITPLNTALITQEIETAVDAARQRIISGECNVFDGLLETNTGETVGEEGSTLPDSSIITGMTWYYRNIATLE